MSKNLDHRSCGTTCRIVLLGFIVGTIIFIATEKLTGGEWITGVLGLLAGYVFRDGVTKAAEAYRDSKQPPSPMP